MFAIGALPICNWFAIGCSLRSSQGSSILTYARFPRQLQTLALHRDVHPVRSNQGDLRCLICQVSRVVGYWYFCRGYLIHFHSEAAVKRLIRLIHIESRQARFET